MFDTDKLPLVLGSRLPRHEELAAVEKAARKKWEPVKITELISSRDGKLFTTLPKPNVPRKGPKQEDPSPPSRCDPPPKNMAIYVFCRNIRANIPGSYERPWLAHVNNDNIVRYKGGDIKDVWMGASIWQQWFESGWEWDFADNPPKPFTETIVNNSPLTETVVDTKSFRPKNGDIVWSINERSSIARLILFREIDLPHYLKYGWKKFLRIGEVHNKWHTDPPRNKGITNIVFRLPEGGLMLFKAHEPINWENLFKAGWVWLPLNTTISLP